MKNGKIANVNKMLLFLNQKSKNKGQKNLNDGFSCQKNGRNEKMKEIFSKIKNVGFLFEKILVKNLENRRNFHNVKM